LIPGAIEPRPSLRVLIVYAQPVFWSMGEGCGAIIFTRLPEAIARRGHEVHVSLPGGSPRDEIYHGFHLRRTPAPRDFVPGPDCSFPVRLYRRASCWTSYQRWGLAAARRYAEEFPPDLILGMGYYEAPVARRLARELKVPNVTRLFGNTLSLSLKRGIRFYTNFPEIIALRTPAELILLNDDGADGEKVARRVGAPMNRLVHVRNGVDFEIFRPGPPSEEVRRRLGIHAGQPLLMTATRLAPEKMLERSIHGLRGLLASHPGAVLALLGEGPERANLEAAAREAGVAERVRFPGPVIQSELPAWYRTADVLLSLLDRTNAANPVFEAMACARVVVCLDAGTTRSLVRDGETGVLLSRKDLPHLGSILGRLLDDRERMRRLGEAAVEAIPHLVMDLQRRLDFEVDLLEEVAARWRKAGSVEGAANGSRRAI
jgi:glycosyltransferase involved in cell wall biosynthesis